MRALLQWVSQFPLLFLRWLAYTVAWLLLLAPHRGIRWHTRVNLLLAMPELSVGERLQLEREIVRNECLMVVESVKAWGMPPEYSANQIQHVEGMDVLQEALLDSKGMIAVVPHLGTWEMMNSWLNQFGSPTIMYKSARNPGVDSFILNGRQRLNATLVPTDGQGVKAILKTLRRGGFTIILPDHVPDESGGVFAPFFGHEVMTTTLVSRLAQRTGCRVIGISCIRSPDGAGFIVKCEKLPDAIHDQDLVVSATALNEGMESMIRHAPAQYMWSYRRFKDARHFKGIYRQTEAQIAQVAL